jgi:hypothetical protein
MNTHLFQNFRRGEYIFLKPYFDNLMTSSKTISSTNEGLNIPFITSESYIVFLLSSIYNTLGTKEGHLVPLQLLYQVMVEIKTLCLSLQFFTKHSFKDN